MFSRAPDVVVVGTKKRWFEHTGILDEHREDAAVARRPRAKKVKVTARQRTPLQSCRRTEAMFSSVALGYVGDGSELIFRHRDMYDAYLGIGSYALLSPKKERHIECALQLVLNSKGVTKFPVVILAAASEVQAVVTEASSKGSVDVVRAGELANRMAGFKAGTVVPYCDELSDIQDVLETWDVANVTLFCFPGHHHIRSDMFSGESRIRKVFHLSSDHVSIMREHRRKGVPYVQVFTDPDAAYDFDPVYASVELNAVHRGSVEDMRMTLLGRWEDRRAPEAWSTQVDQKITGAQECPICYSDLETDRVIMECCASSLCMGCIGKWVAENPTCPNCRAPASYNTVHVIASCTEHVASCTEHVASPTFVEAPMFVDLSGD